MVYEYKCKNEKCIDYNKINTCSISISEYSEDKLPKCDKCLEKSVRVYSPTGLRTFGDGYKS